MTKNQLIKKLQNIPGNPIIISSCDGEGNSFSELCELSFQYYWDSENRELFDNEEIKDEELSVQGLKKCIVLWPS